MDTKYYTYSDNIKLNTFLSIPKILFTNEKYSKLNVTAKIIYSLFLNRYISTTYKDASGPYIIFSDKELQEKLGVGRTTCVRARNDLKECGLISFKKSVSNNKIYLYSYTQQNELDNTHFFTEDDLQNYKFYKFPIEFFKEEYNNLSLTAKLVYTVYLDTLCLSQVNYFVDSQERIYFQENQDMQIKKLNLTPATIKEARNLLQVCGLLLEYKKFSEDIRYYLLKLSHYTDRVKEYKAKNKTEQKEFIKEITEHDRKELILTPMRIGSLLKEKRLQHGLTQQQLVDDINKLYDLNINRIYYSRWENGKRNIPQKIYKLLNEYLSTYVPPIQENDTYQIDDVPSNQNNDTITYHNLEKTKQVDTAIEKNETIEIKKLQQSVSQKENNPKRKKDTNIINTEIKETENINTENTLLINLINNMNNVINHSIMFESPNKDFIIACFDKLRLYRKFYLSKEEHMIEKEEMIQLLNKVSNPLELEKECLFILDKIETSNYQFRTPENQINCFLTFFFNSLKTKKETPSWFKGTSKFITEQKLHSQNLENISIDENIKNLKWWEE